MKLPALKLSVPKLALPDLKFLPRLTREQTMAVVVLGAVAFACLLLMGVSLQMRASAAGQVAEQQELLTRLTGRKPGSVVRGAETSAPAAAFLEAQTSGLAAAKLQTYLTGVISAQQATLMSSGVEQNTRADSADAIRLQASVVVTLNALQRILYSFETGTPYIFVDGLTVQPAEGDPRVAADDPKLRVTLKLRALWRKENAS